MAALRHKTNGKYMCMKTYNDEIEEYGVDFLCGKVYEYKDGYMHSTENGTDVEISTNELKKILAKSRLKELF